MIDKNDYIYMLYIIDIQLGRQPNYDWYEKEYKDYITSQRVVIARPSSLGLVLVKNQEASEVLFPLESDPHVSSDQSKSEQQKPSLRLIPTHESED